MKLYRKLTLLFLSTILFISYANAEQNILVEPINTKFMVLGKAKGSYSIIKNNACFSVKHLELKLHSEAKEEKEIMSIRFGLAVPYEGTIFDYLAQTEHFTINQTLTHKQSITKNNINLCLKFPKRAKNEKYFLSMEIIIKSTKYGHVTTYAHNKDGYTKLMPKPNKVFKPTPKSGAVQF